MGWFEITICAAIMQAVRTALQKSVSGTLGAYAATFARYIYGLPIVAIYCFFILKEFPQLPVLYWFLCLLTGVCQIAATILMLRLMQSRNFTVGSVFAKTEALFVALIGGIFISQSLSLLVWLCIIIGFVGTLFLQKHFTLRSIQIFESSTWLGFACGFLFSITGISIYQGAEISGLPKLEGAALFLFITVSIQVIIMSIWGLFYQRDAIINVIKQPVQSIGIGITSALGSMGWFSAMSLIHPAYVKALGQIEMLFILLISHIIFHEKTRKREYIGIACILFAVIALTLYH